ncbi:MAG: tetratricopeptide repeat protein [Candidatus Acidiferrales bacterium]
MGQRAQWTTPLPAHRKSWVARCARRPDWWNSTGVEVLVARLGFALWFVFYLIVPLETNAQGPGTLMGNVSYADDLRPAKGVVVALSDSEHVQIATQETRDDGEFRFGALQRATYTVSVNAAGYEPVSLDIDISMVSDKGIVIYLKAISKKDSAKAGTISAHELSMPAQARELMESGQKKLYQDKDAQAALADFKRAIAAAPDYYEAYYQAAMAYLTLGNRAEAETSLRKSIEVSADKYGEAEVGLGTVMLDRGSFAEGEKLIRRGLQLNPNLWLGHYELGRALLNEKRISEAQVSAERARQLAPSAAIVYRLLSNIHLEEKDYPALLRDIDVYLQLDPNSPAGIRASQLREQVQQKIGSQQFMPTSARP